MITRIYVVTDMRPDGEAERLVEATSAAAAIRHVASRYKAEAASSKDVALLMAEGVKVEKAGGDKAADAEQAEARG